jgi:import inner membrane translocase subunit TIM50
MLGRAATPLLRPRRFPPAVRLSTFNQTRYYARDRKSRPTNDYQIPASAARPRWQQTPQNQGTVANAVSQEQHSPRTQESNASESSDLQPEFETPANAQRNAPESSGELRFEPRENHTGQPISSSANPPQEDAQPELETSANTERDGPANSRRVEQSDEDLGSPLPGDEQINSAQQPLPDLTKGIPSTLEAELREARSKREASTSSLNITEDPSEPIPSSGGRGAEGLPKSAYISSHEKKKNNIIRYVYLVMFGGLIGYTAYLGRDWGSEEEAHKHSEAPSGWGIALFYNRVKARLAATLDYYNEPAFPSLLPKHDPNIQPPMCLVLSLEDLLIHQEWTRERGWRIAKRPGVDYFLRYLSQYYELVLFTTQPSTMADQVIRKLDPYRIIQWPLFREATLYKDGGYIKVRANQASHDSTDKRRRICLTSTVIFRKSC